MDGWMDGLMEVDGERLLSRAEGLVQVLDILRPTIEWTRWPCWFHEEDREEFIKHTLRRRSIELEGPDRWKCKPPLLVAAHD